MIFVKLGSHLWDELILLYMYILMRINIIWFVGTFWIISKKKKKKKKNFTIFCEIIHLSSKCCDIILPIFSQDFWDQRKTGKTSVTFDVSSLKANKKNEVLSGFQTW